MFDLYVCHNSIDINIPITVVLFRAYQFTCESSLDQFKVKCAINFQAATLSLLCADCKFACMSMKINSVSVWVWLAWLKFTLISFIFYLNVCHNSIEINYALVSLHISITGLTTSLVNLVWTKSRSNVLSIMWQPFCQCCELTVLQSKNLFLETDWTAFTVFSDMFNILPFTKPRSCRFFLTSHKTC